MVTGVNVAKPNKVNKKKNDDQNCSSEAAHNLSKLKCYNWNKKTIIQAITSNFQKTSFGFDNLYASD